jgi:hypothetical protein
MDFPPTNDSEPLICECVADCEHVLVDILAMFRGTTSTGAPYISLPDFNRVAKEYGEPQVALILSLLDRLGYVEHYGNLTCSSALTDAGIALRDSLKN